MGIKAHSTHSSVEVKNPRQNVVENILLGRDNVLIMKNDRRVKVWLLIIGIVFIIENVAKAEKKERYEKGIPELNSIITATKKKEQKVRKSTLVKYQMVGGFEGCDKVLTICKNGRVCYSGESYDLISELDQNYIEKIDEIFNKNNFFSLKTEYLPLRQCADAYKYTITYNYNSDAKTITAETGGTPPEKLLNITSELDTLIEKLKKDVNSGTILGFNRMLWWVLEKWPFTSDIKLSDCYSTFMVNESIFNYVKEKAQKQEQALYFENGYIYILKNSGSSFTHRDPGGSFIKEFGIEIYKKVKPFRLADVDIKLDKIPKEGIFIQGTLYQKIKEQNYL